MTSFVNWDHKSNKSCFYWRYICVQYCLSPFSSTSLHQSLRKAFLYLLAILWNSAFRCLCLSFSPLPVTSLLFSAICKASSDNHFALHFFSLGMAERSLPPLQCYKPPSTVLRALCLLDLIPRIHLSLPLYNHKRFDLGHTWMAHNGFPYFLQFKSEFVNIQQ